MSSLTLADKRVLEYFFNMSSGYVLDFSTPEFDRFCFDAVGIDINSECYLKDGTSKARKLRSFWSIEPDNITGKLILELINYADKVGADNASNYKKNSDACRAIANRLLSVSPNMLDLKQHATKFDSEYLAGQIRRMEDSVNNDPALAIGTAKELVETCCKTILVERGVEEVSDKLDISTLTKMTLKKLKLVPEGVPNEARGADVIKRLLQNLGTIGNGLAELRGLYGTGHGKHGSASGLSTRHAKLAVGSASTLALFLFETHQEFPVNKIASLSLQGMNK